MVHTNTELVDLCECQHCIAIKNIYDDLDVSIDNILWVQQFIEMYIYASSEKRCYILYLMELLIHFELSLIVLFRFCVCVCVNLDINCELFTS